jgi:hypothetical protein
MKDHNFAVNVSVNELSIIITVISYRSIFCPILLSQVNNGGDEMLQAYISQHKFESRESKFTENVCEKLVFILM